MDDKRKSSRRLRLEKPLKKHVVTSSGAMNTKQQSSASGSHRNFKHTAKPAKVEAVLRAFGMSGHDLENVRELVKRDRKQQHLAHAK